jgi:hypothetical protein
MVHECLQRLKTPMLGRFIARMRSRDAEQATRTLERVRAEWAKARRTPGASNAT